MVVAPGGDGCGASDRWGLAELGTAGGAIDGVNAGGSVVIAGVVVVAGVADDDEMTGEGPGCSARNGWQPPPCGVRTARTMPMMPVIPAILVHLPSATGGRDPRPFVCADIG